MNEQRESMRQPDEGRAVGITLHQARLQLAHGEHLRLANARGARLTALEGIAWITVDQEAADTLLRAGECFVVRSNREVVVGSLFSSVTLELGSDGGGARRARNESAPARLMRAPCLAAGHPGSE